MTINNNSVQQINVALLDIDKRLNSISQNNTDIEAIRNDVAIIKASLNETKAGLISGATYDININGNAATATVATTAGTANHAATSGYSNEADHANSSDTVSLNSVKPVNTVYLSVDSNADPHSLFGGTWTSITAPTGMYAWKRTT